MINSCAKLVFQELGFVSTGLQEVDKQFNLGAPGGLQALETVSEPLCPREGMPVMQIENC